MVWGKINKRAKKKQKKNEEIIIIIIRGREQFPSFN